MSRVAAWWRSQLGFGRRGGSGAREEEREAQRKKTEA
jgi:hypothetical protein